MVAHNSSTVQYDVCMIKLVTSLTPTFVDSLAVVMINISQIIFYEII